MLFLVVDLLLYFSGSILNSILLMLIFFFFNSLNILYAYLEVIQSLKNLVLTPKST